MDLPDFVVKLLDDIAKQEKFVEYEIQTKSGSNHGDGYLGVLTSIQLIGKKNKDSDETTTLHLMCKTPPENEIRREILCSITVFARELYIYTKLLPTFVNFQREKGLTDEESFLSFPKVYASVMDEEKNQFAIIMEDLRPRNFQMWPRTKPVPLDHLQLFMRELGKFHGISFALKDQQPQVLNEFKKLGELLMMMIKKSFPQFMDQSLSRTIDALNNQKQKDFVVKLKADYLDVLAECLNGDDKFHVVSHGDSNINNVLFQYDVDGKKVDSICFLDWQLGRYSSPALDIVYHIFSVSDKATRDAHYDELIQLYYSSLSNIVKQLGSDPEKLFSFGDLQQELKKAGLFALIMATMLIQVKFKPVEEIPNLDEFAEAVAKGENGKLVGHLSEEVTRKYSEAIRDVVNDLIAYDYISLE